MKKVDVKRNVFDKEKFNETVDTQFSQLVTTPDPSFFDINLATLGDFWLLYEKFFYLIPKFGDVESHEYLGKTSLEYANSEFINQQIEDLLEEIAALREENLRIMNDALNIGDAIGAAGFEDTEDGPSDPNNPN
tara:strand:- start:4789 stop:5190 length:402 start_codon:yes stop_codon:yes gene_type:complete